MNFCIFTYKILRILLLSWNLPIFINNKHNFFRLIASLSTEHLVINIFKAMKIVLSWAYGLWWQTYEFFLKEQHLLLYLNSRCIFEEVIVVYITKTFRRRVSSVIYCLWEWTKPQMFQFIAKYMNVNSLVSRFSYLAPDTAYIIGYRFGKILHAICSHPKRTVRNTGGINWKFC